MVYREEPRSKRRRRRGGSSKSGRLYGIAKPASDDQLAAIISQMQGARVSGSMGSNVTPVSDNTSSMPGYGRAGGVDMRTAPQVTMRPRPPARPRPKKDAQQGSLDILDQLVQGMLMDTGSATYDYESAIQDATDAIRQAYGAEIGAIRSNNRDARRDTKKGRREIEAMYAGLAKSYGKDSKQAIKAGEKGAKAQMRIGEEGNEILQGANSQIANEEAALLKGLGIQEAAPEILGDNTEQFQKATAQNTSRASRAAGMERAFAGTESRYFDRYAAGADFEGQGRSADLLAALQDYVRNNRNEIASLKGQRAQEIAGAKGDIMSQAAEFQAEQDNLMWERMMEYMGLRKEIEDTNFDNRLDAKQFRWDQKMDQQKLLESVAGGGSAAGEYMPKALYQASQIISNELPREQATRVQAVLKSILGSANFTEDRFKAQNGEMLKMTPEMAMQLARQAGRKAGLGPRELEILALAAYAAAEG